MLADAGVTDLDEDLGDAGSRPYIPNARRAAELIQADFAKVGVKAEIVSLRMGRVSRSRQGEGPRRRRSSRLDRRQRRSGQLPRTLFSAATPSAVTTTRSGATRSSTT